MPDIVVGVMVAFALLIIAAIPSFTTEDRAPAERTTRAAALTDLAGLQSMRSEFSEQQLQFQQTLEEQEVKVQERLAEQATRLTQETRFIRDIALSWEARRTAIHQALLEEFEGDLARWNAQLEADTLLIRFASPDVLFQKGSASLSAEFGDILSDFFPRYVQVLAPFKDGIEEIRIEGHTSSSWSSGTSEQEAFFKNMDLSQRRTLAVLRYVDGLAPVRRQKPWLQPLLTANGLSSSQPILRSDGTEDPDLSRRVEFRIRTAADADLQQIVEVSR